MKTVMLIIIISFALGFLKYDNGDVIFSTEKAKTFFTNIIGKTESKIKSSGIIERTKEELEKSNKNLNTND